MQHRRRRQTHRGFLDPRPGFPEVRDIFRQFSVARLFCIGPQDEAAAQIRIERLQTRAQLLALPLRYFLRHANVIVLRQKNQQPARNTDLAGQARTLGPHGVLEHLHHQ